MTLKAPDMTSCEPKKRCVAGTNKGLAYTPGDECESGFTFDSATCDCKSICACVSESITIRYKVNYRNYNGACAEEGDLLCTGSGGSAITINVSGANMIAGSSYEFVSNVPVAGFDCQPSYGAELRYWGCDNGVPVYKTQNLPLGASCYRVGNNGQAYFELVDPEVIPSTPVGDCT